MAIFGQMWANVGRPIVTNGERGPFQNHLVITGLLLITKITTSDAIAKNLRDMHQHVI